MVVLLDLRNSTVVEEEPALMKTDSRTCGHSDRQETVMLVIQSLDRNVIQLIVSSNEWKGFMGTSLGLIEEKRSLL